MGRRNFFCGNRVRPLNSQFPDALFLECFLFKFGPFFLLSLKRVGSVGLSKRKSQRQEREKERKKKQKEFSAPKLTSHNAAISVFRETARGTLENCQHAHSHLIHFYNYYTPNPDEKSMGRSTRLRIRSSFRITRQQQQQQSWRGGEGRGEETFPGSDLPNRSRQSFYIFLFFPLTTFFFANLVVSTSSSSPSFGVSSLSLFSLSLSLSFFLSCPDQQPALLVILS